MQVFCFSCIPTNRELLVGIMIGLMCLHVITKMHQEFGWEEDFFTEVCIAPESPEEKNYVSKSLLLLSN